MTSPIVLTFDNLELKCERVSSFDQTAAFLHKLIENVHHCGKLISLHFDIDDLFSTVSNLSKIQVGLKKSENGIW